MQHSHTLTLLAPAQQQPPPPLRAPPPPPPPLPADCKQIQPLSDITPHTAGRVLKLRRGAEICNVNASARSKSHFSGAAASRCPGRWCCSARRRPCRRWRAHAGAGGVGDGVAARRSLRHPRARRGRRIQQHLEGVADREVQRDQHRRAGLRQHAHRSRAHAFGARCGQADRARAARLAVLGAADAVREAGRGVELLHGVDRVRVAREQRAPAAAEMSFEPSLIDLAPSFDDVAAAVASPREPRSAARPPSTARRSVAISVKVGYVTRAGRVRNAREGGAFPLCAVIYSDLCEGRGAGQRQRRAIQASRRTLAGVNPPHVPAASAARHVQGDRDAGAQSPAPCPSLLSFLSRAVTHWLRREQPCCTDAHTSSRFSRPRPPPG